MATSPARPYDQAKINVRELTNQLVDFHGAPFNELMFPDGELEGVITFGAPGIGKTQSVMASAKKLAEANGYELVKYKPGVRPTPGKKQMLFAHLPMAGMTSGSIAGFPTTATEKIPAKDASDEDRVSYVSRQVIPAVWRTARDFPACVYLFDEITHVVSQEAMLSLLSEGFYSETTMSQRALFIATANEGVADGTLQQKLSTAFRNRFTLYYIKADVAVWREDYANAKVHPACLAFASLFKDKFENFQAPLDNLMNTATLRGLTKMSESLTYMEAVHLRKRSEVNGVAQIDPKGEWIDGDNGFSSELEMGLKRMAFGRLGNETLAQSFVQLYSLAFKSVIPEIRKIINGKDADLSPDFIAALKLNSKEAVAIQKKGLSGKSSDDELKTAMDNNARAFTFVDYLPRLFLDAWSALPKHPELIKNGDAKNPEKLRAYTQSLMDRFLRGVMYLPSNMQMMAIQNFKELSSLPDYMEAGRKFTDEGKAGNNIPMGAVLHVLAANSKTDKNDKTSNPELTGKYAELFRTFNQSRQATETLTSLDK